MVDLATLYLTYFTKYLSIVQLFFSRLTVLVKVNFVAGNICDEQSDNVAHEKY